MNGILKYNHYTHDIQFQTNVIELLNDLNIVSISYMEKYFEIFTICNTLCYTNRYLIYAFIDFYQNILY